MYKPFWNIIVYSLEAKYLSNFALLKLPADLLIMYCIRTNTSLCQLTQIVPLNTHTHFLKTKFLCRFTENWLCSNTYFRKLLSSLFWFFHTKYITKLFCHGIPLHRESRNVRMWPQKGVNKFPCNEKFVFPNLFVIFHLTS